MVWLTATLPPSARQRENTRVLCAPERVISRRMKASATSYLVETGPLIGFLDGDAQWHERSLRCRQECSGGAMECINDPAMKKHRRSDRLVLANSPREGL